MDNNRKERLVWTWVIRGLVILSIIILPLIISWMYSSFTRLPEQVRLGTGPLNGRYRIIMQSLKQEVEAELGIEVVLVESQGSFENLGLLQDEQVDFALFQSGSDRDVDINEIAKNRSTVSFVANLYPAATHLFVSDKFSKLPPSQWDVNRIALSSPGSADAVIGEMLLQHLGVEPTGSQKPQFRNYSDLTTAFERDEVDAAIVQVGLQAPIIKKVLATGKCKLMGLPYRDAFLARHVAFSDYQIPSGVYRVGPDQFPEDNLDTVSVSAQLLCRTGTHSELVKKITEIVHRPDFAKRNELQEVFAQGNEFSLAKPEFPIHAGAKRYYDPTAQPWMNTDFVERTEGIRSFGVSILIGLFFGIRWLLQWRTRSVEHQLDRYIHELLEIEEEQKALDYATSRESLAKLEKYLDQVTELRREALTEFTAHQLNDDPAITCFLEMSHALSEKISSKLTRGRIGQLSEQLATKSGETGAEST